MQAMTLAPTGTARLAQRLKPLLDPLFGFAHARCGRREISLDAVQEALQAALQAERDGRVWPDDEALWAWLIVVARNKVADKCRQLGREAAAISRMGRPAGADGQALLSEHPLPPDLAENKELKQICRAALSELPPRQRDALEAFYQSGLSQAQIGQRLDISAKAVESLLARAREAVHNVLRRMVDRPEELL